MESESAMLIAEKSRNIVYSKLMMKKDDAKEFTQQLLVARYGMPPRNQEESSPCAEIGVYKGSHNHKKLSQPPLFSILLKGTRMEEESASTDDCKSTRDSKKLNKHSFQFGLLAADGASFKFRVRDEREHRTWTNLIKFLSMFPHSVVPEIPSYDPPAAMGNLGPTLYNKDSIWPVFVMPEEVGFRCRLEGPKILVLENQNEMNQLEIYSEHEQLFPMFSCKHSEIRRIGKMGIFLYVEVGRRCRAGPGLLWLFFGSNNEKAIHMREILCKFLLNKEPVQSCLSPMMMKKSSTAPQLAELPRSPPPLPPGNTGSPRHSLSPTLPSSPPSLQQVQSNTTACATRKHSGSDRTLVADKPTQQNHLCNSYHTLEPLEDTDQIAQQHASEPLQHTHQPQYHVLEPFQETGQAPCSPESPRGQASLYHILEQPQDKGHTAATYHILEPPQGKSPNSPHVTESPKKITPPYYITDLQNRSGHASPQWSIPSPGHRSPSCVSETQSGGMEKNSYHVLETPPAGKHSSYHVLESPPRSRRHFSEKPRRHTSNIAHSQDSNYKLEPPALKDDPQHHLYQEIGATLKLFCIQTEF